MFISCSHDCTFTCYFGVWTLLVSLPEHPNGDRFLHSTVSAHTQNTREQLCVHAGVDAKEKNGTSVTAPGATFHCYQTCNSKICKYNTAWKSFCISCSWCRNMLRSRAVASFFASVYPHLATSDYWHDTGFISCKKIFTDARINLHYIYLYIPI